MATLHEFLVNYGAAVVSRNAALFVGAGLSKPGYPTWNELLSTSMAEASLPPGMPDMALAAEYCVQSVPEGRRRLEDSLLRRLTAVDPVPHEGHLSIRELRINELWTTNYDPLLEIAMPEAQVIVRDEDLLRRRRADQRRIVKLHGSFTVDPPGWQEPPVITRTDYERYAESHPRMWASLTANFLTRPMLFVGFGFTDPNVDVLLRLARSLSSSVRHFTVMRRPARDEDEWEGLLFAHRVRDLENSGVGVVEIDGYEEINPLLAQLVRRARDPRLFVAGSFSDDQERAQRASEAVGARLADLDRDLAPLSVASLAGPAARRVSYAFGAALRDVDRYHPDRIQFHFRRKDAPPEGLDERTGSALHSDLDQDPLRRNVIDDCRAMLVVGGGDTTLDEVAIADEFDLPVIPLAYSGGTAALVWKDRLDGIGTARMGGRSVDPDDYRLLGSDHMPAAVAAAVRMLARAMYLDESPA